MVYVDPDFIRTITYLTTSHISDVDLVPLITYATKVLNRNINRIIQEEQVEYISSEKQNLTDGSNTTFYSKCFPLGDYDNDGDVSTGDIVAYTLDSTGERTVHTISAIDDLLIGKFTLTVAPASGETLYIKYSQAPKDIDESTAGVDMLVKLACAYLSASFAFTKLTVGKIKVIKTVNLQVIVPDEGYKKFNEMYKEKVREINDRTFYVAQRPKIDYTTLPGVTPNDPS